MSYTTDVLLFAAASPMSAEGALLTVGAIFGGSALIVIVGVFLFALIASSDDGCDHKWSNWGGREPVEITHMLGPWSMGTGVEYRQSRQCEKCGVIERRAL